LSPDLDLLLECYRLQAGVLHKHNASLAKTCDKLALEFTAKGDFTTRRFDNFGECGVNLSCVRVRAHACVCVC